MKFFALMIFSAPAMAEPDAGWQNLEQRFTSDVRPFLDGYCSECHDRETAKADLDLSRFKTAKQVAEDYGHWALVLERLQKSEMPPAKARQQPSPEARHKIVTWIQSLRDHEVERNAGDPGPVLARRLSNAEYDYTIHDLTGVDIRPARTFPVDPANQAGFDNSGESLTMSPALVEKYLRAAREIADHLVLKPDGFAFAPHPVVADTDRDKWAVFRIVAFYLRQPTDYADYFHAAWRFKHRAALAKPDATLAGVAADTKISAKYLILIWKTLTESTDNAGPIAKLRTMWNRLPAPVAAEADVVRTGCEEMRDYVIGLRGSIVPEVPNLKARPIQNGSQTLVLWKNRRMAENRRRYDPAALKVIASDSPPASPPPDDINRPAETPSQTTPQVKKHVQAPTPDVVKRGGNFLPPKILTESSSATAQMAAAKRRTDHPDLLIPADPEARPRYEAAFARFADVFPDAFYITERARVYLDAEKEQENAGRLLSAGLHSMTGYFRDDGPLYDLILDEAGRKELDRLWQEFDFVSSVPQRMHTSFVWFERTDSSYMRDPEFDLYRPEDKSVTSQEKIAKLGELYLAKARRNSASETVQRAIEEHFALVAANIQRVEQQRIASEPNHLKTLENFAARAFRRALSQEERQDLHDFYRDLRDVNGLGHEEAMRDCIVRILMSPHFCFRFDLMEASGVAREKPAATPVAEAADQVNAQRGKVAPLSDEALASRMSYFLWASMPDDELLALAAAGDLHRPGTLRAQVIRMLQDERVRNFATEFAGNWLDFRRFEQHNSVDRNTFPAFDDSLRRAMFEEPVRFFVAVAKTNRPVLDFLYAKDTIVNAPLARHYGIAADVEGDDTWVPVAGADRYGRGGLVPMAVFLTANSPGLRTSPVKRGNWVVKRLLGERIPPPPAAVPELPADERNPGSLTIREALEKHRAVESCAACHARFDSFGLVFEAYGPVGERRERDLGGRAVDVRAEFPDGTTGAGLPGLLKYIRKNRQDDFLENFCRKLLACALGRTLILSDEALIRDMRTKLAADEYRFQTLIQTIVASPQFLNRRSSAAVTKN